MSTNNSPRYSIICTLRNNYRCFYDELLEHIINQKEKNFECIFIVDETEVDWVKVPDARFQLVRLNEETPLAIKRNIGIKRALGEYIIFCDADDYLDKDLLQIFSGIIDQYSPDMIIPNCSRNPEDFISEKSHIIEKKNLLDNKDEIIKVFFSRYLPSSPQPVLLDGCWGRAFKRETLVKNNIHFHEEPCRAEDALFVNDFALCSSSVYIITDYFGYYWRMNCQSEMFNVNSFFYNIVPFVDKLSQQIKNVPQTFTKDFYYYVTSLIISQVKTFCNARSNKKIDRKNFISLMKKTAPKGSLCEKYLKKISWKYGKKHKILCFIYSCKLYSLFYFLYRHF